MLKSRGHNGHCVPSVTFHFFSDGVAKFCQADCFESSIRGQSLCSADDLTCLCKGSFELSSTVTDFVYAACSVKKIVMAQNATAEMCDWPIRMKTYVTTVVVSTTGSLSILTFLLRTIDARLFGHFGWHDAYALGAGICAIPMNTVQLLVGRAGFGRDIWTVPFDNLILIQKVSLRLDTERASLTLL
jgi:hypothetical protein